MPDPKKVCVCVYTHRPDRRIVQIRDNGQLVLDDNKAGTKCPYFRLDYPPITAFGSLNTVLKLQYLTLAKQLTAFSHYYAGNTNKRDMGEMLLKIGPEIRLSGNSKLPLATFYELPETVLEIKVEALWTSELYRQTFALCMKSFWSTFSLTSLTWKVFNGVRRQ